MIEMICLYIECYIIPNKLEKFREIAIGLMEKTRREPGCQSYEIGQVGEETVAWMERWKNEEALADHEKESYYLEAEEAMKGFFTKPAQVRRLTPFG